METEEPKGVPPADDDGKMEEPRRDWTGWCVFLNGGQYIVGKVSGSLAMRWMERPLEYKAQISQQTGLLTKHCIPLMLYGSTAEGGIRIPSEAVLIPVADLDPGERNDLEMNVELGYRRAAELRQIAKKFEDGAPEVVPVGPSRIIRPGRGDPS